jgi:PAS domain S-box-containing protein
MKKKQKTGTTPDIAKKKKKAAATAMVEDQYFRTIVEQSPDIILLVDSKGIIKYENKAVEKILGYKLQERIGKSSFDHIHQEELASIKRKIKKFFTDINSPVDRSEVHVRHKDGSWRMFEAICIALPQNNMVNSLIINLRDITQRKAVEKKLQESEANYRQLFENAPAAIYRIDLRNGKFSEANDVFCEYAGCRREEIASFNAFDILSEESKKLFIERIEKRAQGIEVPEIVEYGIINKKGMLMHALLHTKDIYDEEGHVIASDVVAHNITGAEFGGHNT